MTSFIAIGHYSPILVLLLGIATFIGFLGLGLNLQQVIRFSLPSPWKQVIGVLLGIQVSSLAVQILGMAGLAFRPILILVWLVTTAMGGATVIKTVYPLKPKCFKVPRGWSLITLTIGLVGLAINLLVAIAPSSKIDELHYHMLLPSRIVADSALVFYQQPWPGAVFPHMIFQMSLTPLHALGFPDSGNVVSWALSVTLIWFGWYLIRERNITNSWPYIWIASLSVGMYPVVWYVTGGAHSMGDLATASATVALLERKRLIKIIKAHQFAILSSILVLSSIASKVSLLPLGLTILILTLGFITHHIPRLTGRIKVSIYSLVPWIVFYVPILIWTFLHSGSPFGPVLSNVFSHSVYDVETLTSTFKNSQSLGSSPTFTTTIFNTIVEYFPFCLLAFLSVVALLTLKSIPKFNRWIILFLFSIQTLIIFKLLFFNLRFYGGLLQGFLIYFAMVCPKQILLKLTAQKVWISLISVFIFLPPLILQTYFAKQFFPVAAGAHDKHKFYREKIAFYQDYQSIHSLLPHDSVLLVLWGNRINSVYSPRPVYLTPNDIPEGKEVFLFLVGSSSNSSTYVNEFLGSTKYKLGEVVYQNDQAVVATYRTPGRAKSTDVLKVFRLINK